MDGRRGQAQSRERCPALRDEFPGDGNIERWFRRWRPSVGSFFLMPTKGEGSMKKSCLIQVVRLGIVALGLTLAIPAEAQFICGGSVDGTEPQGGGGATASGGVSNFACGTKAQALGRNGQNTATGIAADAHGDNSGN